MLMIDHLAYQSRWVNISPIMKGIGYLASMILAFILPSWGQLSLMCLMIVLVCVGCRMSLRRYLLWVSIPVGFLVLSALTIVVTYHHNESQLLLSIAIADGYVGISQTLLSTAGDTLLRCLCSIAATLCFVTSTPFNQCIVLLKAARLPNVLIEQILLTYRFIFIVIEEAQAIFSAQTLRFGYINHSRWFRSLAMLAGMLLQRVLQRHSYMKDTLAVKLYQGEFPL